MTIMIALFNLNRRCADLIALPTQYVMSLLRQNPVWPKLSPNSTNTCYTAPAQKSSTTYYWWHQFSTWERTCSKMLFFNIGVQGQLVDNDW